MPLSKGLILMAYVAIVCGFLTAVNAAWLHRLVGLSTGVLSTVLAVALAFLQTLLLLELVDRMVLRSRNETKRDSSAPEQTAIEDHASEPKSGTRR
jgi:hypothetical protein